MINNRNQYITKTRYFTEFQLKLRLISRQSDKY